MMSQNLLDQRFSSDTHLSPKEALSAQHHVHAGSSSIDLLEGSLLLISLLVCSMSLYFFI